jgi:hypothetical protein
VEEGTPSSRHGKVLTFPMASLPIRYRGRPLTLHKAIVSPDFSSRTVLVLDPWDYVEMWLKRHPSSLALFYWQQARAFFNASLQLPKTASPLTSYYCFLNATKALLVVKQIPLSEHHGVSGTPLGRRAHLSNERVEFRTGGILPALAGYLGEPTQAATYTLHDILYNLPYIHRAYSLTYSSPPELFVPITEPVFVRKSGSTEAWFCAQVREPQLANLRTLKSLGPPFERDLGVSDRFVVRSKKRFEWKPGASQRANNLERLMTYHQGIRKRAFYIVGPMRLWYLKRSAAKGIIERSSLSLTYAAMHRLSEIARYEPTRLAKHFDSQHNWLLAEFLAAAPQQFVDEIASELTGRQFMAPGLRSVSGGTLAR